MARHRAVDDGPPYPVWPAIRAYGWRRWAALLTLGLLVAILIVVNGVHANRWADRIRDHDQIMRQHDGEKY